MRDLLSDDNSRNTGASARRQRSFYVDIRTATEQPVRRRPPTSRLRGSGVAVDIGDYECLPAARAINHAVHPAGSETSSCIQHLSHDYCTEPLRRAFTLPAVLPELISKDNVETTFHVGRSEVLLLATLLVYGLSVIFTYS